MHADFWSLTSAGIKNRLVSVPLRNCKMRPVVDYFVVKTPCFGVYNRFRV